jgi:hypothetical protein
MPEIIVGRKYRTVSGNREVTVLGYTYRMGRLNNLRITTNSVPVTPTTTYRNVLVSVTGARGGITYYGVNERDLVGPLDTDTQPNQNKTEDVVKITDPEITRQSILASDEHVSLLEALDIVNTFSATLEDMISKKKEIEASLKKMSNTKISKILFSEGDVRFALQVKDSKGFLILETNGVPQSISVPVDILSKMLMSLK